MSSVAPFILLGCGLTVAACAHPTSTNGSRSARDRAKSANGAGAIASATEPRLDRIVVSPDEIASIDTNDSARNAMPKIFVLGRSENDTRLFLHFTVHLPKNGVMHSATLLLSRTEDVDMAPSPVELHAMRVVDPWDARSITWPFQPRIEEARAPHAIVTPSSGRIIRLDVRPIVEEWSLRDPKDQGIAVVTDKTNATGTSFAYISENARPPELEVVWAVAEPSHPVRPAGAHPL